jgi:hypothetical protein
MTTFGQAAIATPPPPNIGIISQYMNLFQSCGNPKYTIINCFSWKNQFWHKLCKVVRIAGMVRDLEKEINMTQYVHTQILSAFAAVICAFITIGISVAPAVAPAAAIIA